MRVFMVITVITTAVISFQFDHYDRFDYCFGFTLAVILTSVIDKFKVKS